jgi:hypothetical protein
LGAGGAHQAVSVLTDDITCLILFSKRAGGLMSGEMASESQVFPSCPLAIIVAGSLAEP